VENVEIHQSTLVTWTVSLSRSYKLNCMSWPQNYNYLLVISIAKLSIAQGISQWCTKSYRYAG